MSSMISMNPRRPVLGLEGSTGISGLASAALAANEKPNRKATMAPRLRPRATLSNGLFRVANQDLLTHLFFFHPPAGESHEDDLFTIPTDKCGDQNRLHGYEPFVPARISVRESSPLTSTIRESRGRHSADRRLGVDSRTTKRTSRRS